jgi:ornithine cyclodeaminase
MALIGNGAQSEFQALAFHHLLGITSCACSTPTRPPPPSCSAPGRRARPAPDGLRQHRAEAVRGADIVTTVTADKTNATILTPEMLAPGMHLNAVGGDCPGKTELHPRCCAARAWSWSTSRSPASRASAADAGRLPRSPSSGACWPARRRAARAPSRSRCSTRSALRWRTSPRCACCTTLALPLGLGTPLPLLPELADPRDLFGCLQPQAHARAAA